MCDADADGNVYAYSILTGDLLEGAGGELIGLQLTADGGFEGEPQAIAEKVCVAHTGEAARCWRSPPTGSKSIRASHLCAERGRRHLSVQCDR